MSDFETMMANARTCTTKNGVLCDANGAKLQHPCLVFSVDLNSYVLQGFGSKDKMRELVISQVEQGVPTVMIDLESIAEQGADAETLCIMTRLVALSKDLALPGVFLRMIQETDFDTLYAVVRAEAFELSKDGLQP